MVFARRGYASATVDEIAGEAGMSIGALYSRLGAKEDVFLAVFDRYLDRRRVELREVLSVPIDAQAAARAWFDVLDARRDQLLLFVEFWLHATRESSAAARHVAQALQEFDSDIEGALTDRIEGIVAPPSDPRRVARSIIAAYRGAAISHAISPSVDWTRALAESSSLMLSAR